MSDGNAINQSDVEKLLAAKSGKSEAPVPEPQPTVSPSPQPDAAAPATDAAPLASTIDQGDIEKLLATSSAGGKSDKPSPPEPTSATATPTRESMANVPPTAPSTSAAPPIPGPEQPKADDANKVLGQNDIESLLKGAGAAPGTTPKIGAGIGMPQGAEEDAIDEGVPQGDIDYLLRRAEEALESITSDGGSLSGGTPEVLEFQFPEFGGSTPNSDHATLDQISEVELDIKIELGRTNMYLEDILKLRKGSVVALDKIAGDAVDIYVNERLIARGEVLVLNDNFCVRVAELLAGAIPIE